MKNSSHSGQALLALTVMVLIWGFNFPLVKAALGEIPPPVFNALRFPLASLVVWLALRRQGPIPWPDPADRARVLLLGLLGNVAYQQCFIYGLAYSHAGIASVLLAGSPVLTTLFSSLAGHERVSARVWTGVLLGFAGIALVIAAGEGEAGGSSRLGNLIMVGATFAWAMYTVGAHRLVERYGPVPVTAWTLWAGTFALVLIGLPPLLRFDLRVISPASWGGVVYAGALSIGVAYLIWYYAVSRLGNSRTSAFSNLTPVVALTAAWLQLGEQPGLWQLVGAAVVLAAVALTQSESFSLPSSSRPGTARIWFLHRDQG